MQVHHGESTRVTLGIVSLGISRHLADCISSLAAHASREPFRVVWVNNSDGLDAGFAAPDDVLRVDLDTNLGWAGGLHVARAHLDSEYFVWVQDDMQVEPGWLDALVEAADAHPEIAAFGSLAMLDESRPDGPSGGRAIPYNDVASWNLADAGRLALPTELAIHDWVTGKGMLTRVSAWDAVHGADPRQFPLNHVDKDYCTHLRAHGLTLALVPDARLTHVGSASSPSPFRSFLAEWHEPRFNARWGETVAVMDASTGPVEHDCSSWLPTPGSPEQVAERVRQVAGDEAARMLVPAMRWMNGVVRERDEDEVHVRLLEESRATEQRFTRSSSWRVTAPLRAAARVLARLRRPSR